MPQSMKVTAQQMAGTITLKILGLASAIGGGLLVATIVGIGEAFEHSRFAILVGALLFAMFVTGGIALYLLRVRVAVALYLGCIALLFLILYFR